MLVVIDGINPFAQFPALFQSALIEPTHAGATKPHTGNFAVEVFVESAPVVENNLPSNVQPAPIEFAALFAISVPFI